MNPLHQDLTIPVIAIDGGGKTGKTTVMDLVAMSLGWNQLNSGALYRAVGAAAIKHGYSSSADIAARALKLDLRTEGKRIFLDDEDQTMHLMSEEIGRMASIVSQMEDVRSALLQFQLNCRKLPGLVADGRDMCLVFDTPHKFYLWARPQAKADRRVLELRGLGQNPNPAEILAEIERRDHADMTRTVRPLQPHPKAFSIDTSDIPAEEVAGRILRKYHESIST